MNRRTIATLCALAVLVGSAVEAASPVAHWKLDGDAADATGRAPAGEVVGRCQFVPSPVVGGGEMVALNGVDAHLKLGDPNASGDFTLTFWMYPLELRDAGVIGSADNTWRLDLKADASLQLTAGHVARTPPQRIFAGQWYHVALVMQGRHLALRLNSESAATEDAASVRVGPIPVGKTSAGFFNGLIDDVRLYDAGLDEPTLAALTDAGLPWLRARPRDGEPFNSRFSVHDGDVIVFTGGEDTVSAAETGHLETLLASGNPDKHLYFRTLAWEADTAYEQGRMVNFDPWPRQLQRVGAGIVFAEFGKAESLRGKAAVPEFISAYEKLLDEFSRKTKRAVLIAPAPFEAADPPRPDLTRKNDDLREYVAAIKSLARRRGCVFVDLFTPLLSHRGERLTRDGMHRSPKGQAVAACEVIRQLTLDLPAGAGNTDATGRFARPQLESIRQAVVVKNRMWSSYWRPTNWAFLAGDRITQPSSRDHLDPRVRWFPIEIQQYQALIATQESKIAERIKAASAEKQ